MEIQNTGKSNEAVLASKADDDNFIRFVVRI